MKIYLSSFSRFALAILFILPPTVYTQIPKVHQHPGRMDSMLKEIEPDFSIAETKIKKDAVRENLVRNKNRTFEAFTVEGSRIYLKDLNSGKVFELKGLPFEWRDFSDLAWSNNQTLMFDRWVEPHYGNHYAVNIVKRKLLDAAPFPDEFILKQRNKKR
jgi:hypothetical protein